MIEMRIRVVATTTHETESYFYGKSCRTKVVEEYLQCEKDDRDETAPSGIKAKIKIEDTTFDITISRLYLDYGYGDDVDTGFFTHFRVDGKMYALHVVFLNKDNSIKSIEMAEWYSEESFTECEDEDKTYKTEDFISYEPLVE